MALNEFAQVVNLLNQTSPGPGLLQICHNVWPYHVVIFDIVILTEQSIN